MTTATSKLQHKTWTKGPYTVTTDSTLIPLSTLNEYLATPDVYWANPLPISVLKETIDNSLCFGMYHNSNVEGSSPNAGEKGTFIGFGRVITDFTTFAYLTDVFVSKQHQKNGLGRWLLSCVKETIDAMPYLRRHMLFTSDWKRSVPFYEEVLDMKLVQGRKTDDERGGEGVATMSWLGPGFPRELLKRDEI